MFRAPLLYPSAIAVDRLDITSTRAVNPTGTPSVGYDPDFREPYSYETTGNEAVDTVRYLPTIRIPCQVEVKTFEKVRQEFGGDAPITELTFVLHNSNLVRMGLSIAGCGCDASSSEMLKTNDKIIAIEQNGRPGRVVQTFKEDLFIYEIRPGSWGFGPTGQDLQIIYTCNRPRLALI